MTDPEEREPSATILESWMEIVEHLGAYPPPLLTLDQDGDPVRASWIFRGVCDATFKLQPSIERCAEGTMNWAALETIVSDEFRYRAPMHLKQGAVPEDEFTWLALMQHHGVPTRLLDFTFSPFVALYFASRLCAKVPGHPPADRRLKIWAIDATAVGRQYAAVVATAQRVTRVQISLRP
jgi:hypothetical protein